MAPAPAATITGTIATSDGSPLPAGVSTLLQKPDGTPILDIEDQPVATPLNSDGTFSIATEQGNYRLAFEVPAGYTPLPSVAVDATAGPVDLGTLALSPTTTIVPAAPELAATGADPYGILIIGLLLLAAGAGAATTSRRSRRRVLR